MSISRTPNYNLAKPAPKTEKNVWGPPLNENWDAVDQALFDLQSQIDAISVVGSAAYTAQSVDEVRSLTNVSFPGIAINLISWHIGMHQGGGLFYFDETDITSADNSGTIIVDTSSRRWRRVYEGAITPSMFGALQGASQPDQNPAFTILHNFINTSGAVHSCDLIGTWNIGGDLPDITRGNFRYYSSGYCKINRISDGSIFKFTGDDVGLGVPHIEIDGGGFDGPLVNFSGVRPEMFFTEAYNTTGHGMLFADGSDAAMTFFNRASFTGVGGIGAGSAKHSVFGFNVVHDTGTEGIQGNLAEKSIFIGNVGYNCFGIGFLGMDKAIDCAYVGNLGYGSNHNGISSGDNRGGTSWVTHVGNVMVDGDHYGIDIKMKYARGFVTGITKAKPCVITFRSLAITGATNANPCAITCTAHGLSNGDRICIHGVVGMTQINSKIYRITRTGANNFTLNDEITYLPIDSTAYGVRTSGGTVDHPLTAGDYLLTTGVVGMVEINGIETFAKSVTNTTVTLMDMDGNDLDSLIFTPYVSGGISATGGAPSFVSAIGNVLRSNADGPIHVGSSQPLGNTANHIILGNQASVSAVNTGPFVEDNITLGRSEDFEASVSVAQNNVTGNGVGYTVIFQQNSDSSNLYDGTTGKFTTAHSGRYFFKATIGVTGAGTATSAIVDIVMNDMFGGLLKTFREHMIPAAGLNASSTWYGTVMVPTVYLEAGTVIKAMVTVGGLAAGAVSIVADITTNFSGGLRA